MKENVPEELTVFVPSDLPLGESMSVRVMVTAEPDGKDLSEVSLPVALSFLPRGALAGAETLFRISRVFPDRLPHLDLVRLGDAGLGRGVDHLLQIRTCASGAQFCFDDGPGSAVSVQELK